MFLQPQTKIFAASAESKIPEDALVISIEQGGEAKTYPIQQMGYHHQLRDTICRFQLMDTYFTVCRKGRI